MSSEGSSASGRAKVAVCIVTYNDAEDLPACVEAVAAQTYRPLELVLVDNASSDGSADVARELAPPIPCRCLANDDNLGFAAGMNQAFAATDAPLLLTLNADARPAPDYLERLVAPLVEAESAELRVGAVTGRLVREGRPPTLDACGMYLLPTWRHLDRGSGEADEGQYQRAEQVFGGTGAATLWVRAALEDTALRDGALADSKVDAEIFDSWFHSFREDAELCFRLAERGWAVLYEPSASAVHRRCNLPERRRAMPAYVNYHSLKNRYLLRGYHQTPRNFARTLLPTLLRDLLALAYVLLVERSSLGVYGWLWRQRRDILRRRRWIRQRQTVAEVEVDRWFRHRALPLPTPQLHGPDT